jgi:hypothetical protein
MNNLFVWVDASHVIHEDMKRNTGDVMLLGTGILYGKLSKQKLNTRSMTQSEFFISEYLPYDLWQIHFYKHQGYNMINNIVFRTIRV